jgi:hypothetical protein
VSVLGAAPGELRFEGYYLGAGVFFVWHRAVARFGVVELALEVSEALLKRVVPPAFTS